MRFKLLTAGALLAISGVLALATQGDAQVKKGKTRPLTTKRMMSGLIGPQTGVLRQGLQGAGPADDKAWESLAVSAELLNESGHLLMEDGRCPDKTWADASKALQDGAAAVLAKVEAKDAAGAREALTMVAGSCKSCHMAHKK